jgi:anti-sigma factor RsiW
MICLKDSLQGAEILTDYCAGALEPIRAAELEAHLHECAACRGEVDAQRNLWNALDVWPPVEVRPGFDARLYARIGAEGKQPWWASVTRPPFRRTLIPAAAAAAVLAVALLNWSPANNSVSHAPSAAVTERLDLQQVEQALDDMDLLTPVSQSSRVL